MSAINFLDPDIQMKRYRAKVKFNEAKKVAQKADSKNAYKPGKAVILMNERLKNKNN